MCTGESWIFGGAMTLGIWFMLITAITVMVWVTVKLFCYWADELKIAPDIYDYMANREKFRQWKDEHRDN